MGWRNPSSIHTKRLISPRLRQGRLIQNEPFNRLISRCEIGRSHTSHFPCNKGCSYMTTVVIYEDSRDARDSIA